MAGDVIVRILAFYMLETAGSPDTRRMANTMRLFKTAVKAARLCIGTLFLFFQSLVNKKEHY